MPTDTDPEVTNQTDPFHNQTNEFCHGSAAIGEGLLPTDINTEMTDQTDAINSHMDEFRHRATEVGESVRAMASEASSAAGEGLEAVEDFVRRKPFQALLLAAVGGAVVYALLRK